MRASAEASFTTTSQRSRALAAAPGALDRSMVYCSSEIADGNAHGHFDLPVLIAGRGGGVIETGRHVRHDGVRLANLYLAILQGLGVGASSFGDSNGTVPLG